jgi:hypothetical protein
MVNYTKSNYNPITNEPIRRISTASAHRPKGLAEFYDLTKLNNSNVSMRYQEALKKNPMAFHRKSGEFSSYADVAGKRGRRVGELTTSFIY